MFSVDSRNKTVHVHLFALVFAMKCQLTVCFLWPLDAWQLLGVAQTKLSMRRKREGQRMCIVKTLVTCPSLDSAPSAWNVVFLRPTQRSWLLWLVSSRTLRYLSVSTLLKKALKRGRKVCMFSLWVWAHFKKKVRKRGRGNMHGFFISVSLLKNLFRKKGVKKPYMFSVNVMQHLLGLMSSVYFLCALQYVLSSWVVLLFTSFVLGVQIQ